MKFGPLSEVKVVGGTEQPDGRRPSDVNAIAKPAQRSDYVLPFQRFAGLSINTPTWTLQPTAFDIFGRELPRNSSFFQPLRGNQQPVRESFQEVWKLAL